MRRSTMRILHSCATAADMSFILDALKKSETDRQRQSTPALFEVKVAAPRRRIPTWSIAVGALLVVKTAAVFGLVLLIPPSPAVARSLAALPAAQTPAGMVTV